MVDVLNVIKSSIINALQKFQSRKFLVWVVSTIALFEAVIISSDWLMITMIYLGAEGLIDWKGTAKKE